MKQTIIYSALCISIFAIYCDRNNDSNNDATIRPRRTVCISPEGKVSDCTDNGSDDKFIELWGK